MTTPAMAQVRETGRCKATAYASNTPVSQSTVARSAAQQTGSSLTDPTPGRST